jgi:hypothetical protein
VNVITEKHLSSRFLEIKLGLGVWSPFISLFLASNDRIALWICNQNDVAVGVHQATFCFNLLDGNSHFETVLTLGDFKMLQELSKVSLTVRSKENLVVLIITILCGKRLYQFFRKVCYLAEIIKEFWLIFSGELGCLCPWP